jgi:two-component system nitrate/nitrite response regulator NarL
MGDTGAPECTDDRFMLANGNHAPGRPSVKTCVLADDHPAVTHVISQLLVERGYSVVASVADGASALAAIELHRPDVAIVDFSMPGLTGVEVARASGRSTPGTGVMLFTAHGHEALMHEALEAGVRGLVLKHAPITEVVRAVELVADGKIYIDPTLAVRLIAAGKRRAKGDLTQRERDVLRLIADGKTNDQIGLELFISPQTVRTYVRKAMSKMQAANRTQAVANALRRSLIA